MDSLPSTSFSRSAPLDISNISLEGSDVPYPILIKKVTEICQLEDSVDQRIEKCNQALAPLVKQITEQDAPKLTNSDENTVFSKQWKTMILSLLNLLDLADPSFPSAAMLLWKICECLIRGPSLETPIQLPRIVMLAVRVPVEQPAESYDFAYTLTLCLVLFGVLQDENTDRWCWECATQYALGRPLLSWIKKVVNQRFESNKQEQMQVCRYMLRGLVKQNLVDSEDYLFWALGLLKRCLYPHPPSTLGLPADPAGFASNADLLEGKVKIPDTDLVFFPYSPDREEFLIELSEFVIELWNSFELAESEINSDLVEKEIDSLLGLSVILAHNLRLYQKNDRIHKLTQVMGEWCQSNDIQLADEMEAEERTLSQQP